MISLNGLSTSSAPSQTFATSTSGTNFGITSSGSVHTFAIPNAGASSTGLITNAAQTLGGLKTFGSGLTVSNFTNLSTDFIRKNGNSYLVVLGDTPITMENTTNSTSKSTGALIVNGGVGVSGSVYCNNIFGSNRLSNYYVIMLEASISGGQTFTSGVDSYFAFNTVKANPSGMTTWLSTGTDDGFTLPVTGFWMISFNTYICISDTNPAYTNIYLTRVGSAYDTIISQPVTSFSGGNPNAGWSVNWTGMRYYYAGQRLAMDMNCTCTPATLTAGHRWNDGQVTRFSAQFMGF